MIDDLLSIPPHLRVRLANALDAGTLSLPCSSSSLQSALGMREIRQDVFSAMLGFERLGVTAPVAAMWLRSIDSLASKTRYPDLVWSGPEVPGVHARDTRRVYEELVSSAKRTMFVSTYVFFDGPRAFDAISRRLDETPDLQVRLLLNIQRPWRDTRSAHDLVRQFADHFWTVDWPGHLRPCVFYDPRSVELDGPRGVLHAKGAVIDGETVFITSANLTEAGLDRNFELGVLVRDPALATSVASHFQTLIDRQLLLPLPTQ